MRTMKRTLTMLRKCAFGFALLFLAVYSLDYVPGIMDANGKMFGLFSMTTFVDIGHLGLGLLALVGGLTGQKAARVYFWFLGFFYAADVIIYAVRHLRLIPPTTNLLVNLPHILVSIAAFLIAITSINEIPMLSPRVRRNIRRCLRATSFAAALFLIAVVVFSLCSQPVRLLYNPTAEAMRHPVQAAGVANYARDEWIRSTRIPSGTSCGVIRRRRTFNRSICPLAILIFAISANSGRLIRVCMLRPAGRIPLRSATTSCWR